MYFCPICSYILDIGKSSNDDTENTEDIIKISNIDDIFKLLTNNIDLSNYKPTFSKDDIIKNKKYKKISESDKNKINQLYDNIIHSGAEFKCPNCNYNKEITTTTLLYQITIDDKSNLIKSLEENELITTNPILPHTHDYSCKNVDCSTHKNIKLKNAVFYKEKNSYKVNYICCVCYYGW
jgi:hypothetical protein